MLRPDFEVTRAGGTAMIQARDENDLGQGGTIEVGGSGVVLDEL